MIGRFRKLLYFPKRHSDRVPDPPQKASKAGVACRMKSKQLSPFSNPSVI